MLVLPQPGDCEIRVALSEPTVLVPEVDPAHREPDAVGAGGHLFAADHDHPPFHDKSAAQTNEAVREGGCHGGLATPSTALVALAVSAMDGIVSTYYGTNEVTYWY